MLVAAIPQVLIYALANGITTYMYPQLIGIIFLRILNVFLNFLETDLPRQAPSLLTFFIECTCCFVIGDFLIYSEHRIMHIIPYCRFNLTLLFF